jgi:DNA-binding Xre family transcriptional regulator
VLKEYLVTNTGVALPSESEATSPAVRVVHQAPGLRAQQVRFEIQRQYFESAERGEISKVRAWRVLRGMDQSELASRAGMTQPEVSRAERIGQALRMKGETLRRIARALNVPVDDLF